MLNPSRRVEIAPKIPARAVDIILAPKIYKLADLREQAVHHAVHTQYVQISNT
jgi:hypothetical protein